MVGMAKKGQKKSSLFNRKLFVGDAVGELTGVCGAETFSCVRSPRVRQRDGWSAETTQRATEITGPVRSRGRGQVEMMLAQEVGNEAPGESGASVRPSDETTSAEEKQGGLWRGTGVGRS